MAIDLRPSTELPLAELADHFTASYEGYFVPFTVDEEALMLMVDVFDLDLAESLVAVENGTPVGLANLGRRGGPSRGSATTRPSPTWLRASRRRRL